MPLNAFFYVSKDIHNCHSIPVYHGPIEGKRKKRHGPIGAHKPDYTIAPFKIHGSPYLLIAGLVA
jgi:hypothetical protein